jgi:hypothetical protein
MRPAPFAAALLLTACATQAPEAAPSGEMKSLAQVDSATVKMMGTTAVIRVSGMAPTPGYRNWTLRPVQYIQAPPDGVYDFTAVGAAPTGIVPFHTVPVQFTYRWTHVAPNVRGVRIHANDSAVEARIPGRH